MRYRLSSITERYVKWNFVLDMGIQRLSDEFWLLTGGVGFPWHSADIDARLF